MAMHPSRADLILPLHSSQTHLPYEHIHRTSSQPPPIRTTRRKKRSVNDIRAKPAQEETLLNIINSLQNLGPTPVKERDQYYEVLQGLQTRPDSNGTLPIKSSRGGSDAPSPITREGFGMDFGAFDLPKTPDICIDNDRAASFPVIPTSRSQRSSDASSLSQNGASGLRRLIHSSSIRSGNSVSSVERAGDTSLGRRLSLRLGSRDARQTSPGGLADQRTLDKRPNQMMMASGSRDSPASTTRLTTGASTEESGPKYKRSPSKQPASAIANEPRSNQSPPSSKRSSLTKSPIADAIPLRMSSLRQSEIVDSPVKRHRKKKKKSIGVEAPKAVQPAEPDILEELGEEDETVKRIKELKRQREIRMRQIDAETTKIDPTQLSTLALPIPANQNASSTTPGSSTVNRANEAQGRLADGNKAHKVLGFPEAPEKLVSKPDRSVPTNRLPDQLSSQRGPSWQPKTATSLDLLSHTTAPSDTRRRASLDHSYAQAIHASPTADINKRDSIKTTHSQSLNALDLKGLDHHSTSVGSSNRSSLIFNPLSRHSSHSGRSSAEKRRPRRYSMNDARRHTRILEEYHAEEERRNSIDKAVDQFLENSRLSRRIRHPQTGRIITYSDVGDPSGAVVFVCVGMGLTRYVSAFYDELATTLRLRLITPDRPGVGGSEAYPERDKTGPLGWPDDVLSICQELGITKFGILAHSAGAIYALATALILPHHVHGKVHLLAPWIPPSQLETYGYKNRPNLPPTAPLPRSQRFLRVLPVPFLKAANSTFLGINTGSMTPVNRRTSPNGKKNGDSPSSDRKKRMSMVLSTSPSQSKAKKRPEPLHRHSMMLMDQVFPTQDAAFAFPLPTLPESESPRIGQERPVSFVLSATATPTEEDFSLASEALNAAEHTVQERQKVYGSLLVEKTWDMATRNSNPAVDLIVCLERNRDIGFRYVDIQRKVVITHGSEDKRVPVENVKWIGEQMNRRSTALWAEAGRTGDRIDEGGCEVRILPGEGHGLMASAIVMGDVLSEIAGEWKGVARY